MLLKNELFNKTSTHSMRQLYRFFSKDEKQSVARSIAKQNRNQSAVKFPEAILYCYYSAIQQSELEDLFTLCEISKTHLNA